MKKNTYFRYIFSLSSALLLSHCDQYASSLNSSGSQGGNANSSLLTSGAGSGLGNLPFGGNNSSGQNANNSQQNASSGFPSVNSNILGGGSATSSTSSNTSQASSNSASGTPGLNGSLLTFVPPFKNVSILEKDGDYLLTLDSEEGVNEGYQNTHALIFLAQSSGGIFTTALWRCRVLSYHKWWHFVSLDPNCEGQVVDSTTPLGYVASVGGDFTTPQESNITLTEIVRLVKSLPRRGISHISTNDPTLIQLFENAGYSQDTTQGFASPPV